MQLDKAPQRLPIPQKPRPPRNPYWLLLILLGLLTAWMGLMQYKMTSVATEAATTRRAATPTVKTTPSALSELSSAAMTGLSYRTHELAQATVHVVQLPADAPLSIAVADELTTVEAFAQRENALAVLNGGFFDPQNGLTTSHLMVDGQQVGNPADNQRLIGNPALQSYLPKILDRSELRAYQCNASEGLRYDITFHRAAPPDNCAIAHALGAGPQLIPRNTSTIEAFTDYQGGELIRDAIGSVRPNARSAIALKQDNSMLLLMAAQRLDAPGLTLFELAEFATSLGATKLLNLDGGSSSSLYYDGQTHLGRLDADGNAIQRPVKSVIVIGKE